MRNFSLTKIALSCTLFLVVGLPSLCKADIYSETMLPKVKTEKESYCKSIKETVSSGARITSATRADNSTSLEGIWVFQLGDYYGGALNPQPSNLSILDIFEVSLDGDQVLFIPQNSQLYPFVGTYNSANSQITFKRELIGQEYSNSGTIYVFQESFVCPTTGLTLKDITATYNAEEGTISFEADNGILWAGYTQMDGTGNMNIYKGFDLEDAYYVEDGGDEADWRDAGEATFMDGWILPLLGIDQTKSENLYKVPVQRNKTNPYIFRLVDPYHEGPAAVYNINPMPGYITFDIYDPEHVVFLKSQAGFTSSLYGIATFYCYNRLGSKLAEAPAGTTPSQIIAANGDKIPYTTYENGVIKLTYITSGSDVIYDANFGNQFDTAGGFNWFNDTGKLLNMTALIDFTDVDAGVNEIIEENKAPVYYNLQGLKISNPQKGQVVIIRKGNNSKKVIF